jgi:hypothetical protein
LAEKGCALLTIDGHPTLQLGYDLEEVSRREIILADGSRKSIPMVGLCEFTLPTAIAIFPLWLLAMKLCLGQPDGDDAVGAASRVANLGGQPGQSFSSCCLDEVVV